MAIDATDERQPDLNLLRVFEAMMRHANVTIAAGQLGLSQSAMSSALGRLRRQFGDPLFVKTRSGMLATPRALELAAPLTEALTLVRKAVVNGTEFNPRTATKVLRIYMTDVGETVLLPALMRYMKSGSSAIRIETAQLPAAEVPIRLETGDLDLAIGYLPNLSGQVRRAGLFDEHYVCITRHDHLFGQKASLQVREFLAAKHVLIESLGSGHQIIERTLDAHGMQRNVALCVPHFVVIPLIVASTDLLVTIPSRVADVSSRLVKLKIHPAANPDPELRVFNDYWHERFENEAANRWLRGVICDL